MGLGTKVVKGTGKGSKIGHHEAVSVLTLGVGLRGNSGQALWRQSFMGVFEGC